MNSQEFMTLSFGEEEDQGDEDDLLHDEGVDIGQNHPDWIAWKKSSAYGEVYNKRIEHFLSWQSHIIDDSDLLTRLKSYFYYFHDLKDDDGAAHFAPTVFRGWFSQFAKFWLMSGKGKLKELAPMLYDSFTTWETNYVERHAHEFTKVQLLSYHALPDTPQTISRKGYQVIASSFGARSGECFKTMFAPISREEDFVFPSISKEPDLTYKIKYPRKKVRGKRTKKDTFALITGI